MPKLEAALFRNKSIEVELTTCNPLEKSDKSIWRRKTTYRSNHDRFVLTTTTLQSENTIVRILRPGHIYVMSKSSADPYLINSDKTVPEEVSDSLISIAWWNHPHMHTDNGIGHGVISGNEDWYTQISNDLLPVKSITEMSDSGRRCYCVIVPQIKDKNYAGGMIYFDKASFMMFRLTGGRLMQDGSITYFEQVIDFDMKPGDFDSIVLKNYKMYAENKHLKLPRHVSEEHIYSVYKTTTHPPETFRLEQFGLPDVAERPRAASRRSLGFLVAGLILGGFLLVAWRRGRHAPKTA